MDNILRVCLYPINVKTAASIGSNVLVQLKVYRRLKAKDFVLKKM